MPSRIAPPDVPVRHVLDGVPRVGFYPKQSVGSPEDHCFPACVRACLEYLGDDIYEQWIAPYAEDWHGVHVFTMGASGNAFSFSWRAGDWEHQTAWAMEYVEEDPLEPVRRAFGAVGYEAEILVRSGFADTWAMPETCDDEAVYRGRILASLLAGRPVIAFGVVGSPEQPAPCIVAGYDDSGETLLGWSFFQDDHELAEAVEIEPSGYFRKPGWFPDTRGIVVLGAKRDRPPREVVYREALLQGLRLLRTEATRGVAAGQAAYAAWLADLADDAAVAALDARLLGTALGAHSGAGGHLAEARCWADLFFNQAAEALPDGAREFHAAGRCFLVIHDLVWRLWQTMGHTGPEPDEEWFACPEVRAALRRVVEVFREQDALAAAHLERGLSALGIASCEMPPASVPEAALVTAAERRALEGLGDPARFVRHGTDGAWVEGVPALDAPADGSDGLAEALAAALAPTRRPCSADELTGWMASCPPGAGPTGRAAAIVARGGPPLRVEACREELDSLARARLATEVGLSLNAALPVVVGYDGGYAVAWGYHCWSETLFLRLPGGGDEQVRVKPSDPLLTGPFVFVG